MRILVPLDGSVLAERALGPAIQLARHAQPRATIILFRAAKLSSILAGGYPVGPVAPMDTDAISDRTECATYLQAISSRRALSDTPVETSILTGITSDAICQAAQDLRADFIVMASHGRTGFARTALGSVADEVLRRSHVPTLIVRAEQKTLVQETPAHPPTILIPLDGSPLAECIIVPARSVAHAFGGQIRLLHVLPDHDHTAGEHAAGTPWLQAQDYLAGMRRRLENEGVTTDYVIMRGHTAEAIAAYAREHACDLVALATHGRSGIPRMVLGSVASALISRLHAPLLVVHPLRAEQQVVETLPEEELFTD